MESLPRELLAEITKLLPLNSAARLAQTCKSFNTLIWTLITILDTKDTKSINESTTLDKFKNIEALRFDLFSSVVVPQDLSRLTTLQILQITFHGTDASDPEAIFMLQKLTNLRELTIKYKDGFNFDQFDDLLLANHSRLTFFEIRADNVSRLNPFTWKFMTRLRWLRVDEVNYAGSIPKFSADLIQNLWTLTQLRGLSLSMLSLEQNIMATGLSKLIHLEELEIYDCKSQDVANSNWFVDYNELLDLKNLTRLSIMEVDLNAKLTNILSKMTQLEQLDLFEMENVYELSPYSNLTNLKRIWFGLDIVPEDPGLEFSQMPNLEVVSIPWCPNVTQLVRLKKLRELFLRKGSGVLLDFLNDCVTVQELTLSSELLPENGYIDLQRMTNLRYFELYLNASTAKKIDALKELVRSLSVLPSLSILKFDQNFNDELLPVIATSLKQLQILRLPNSNRYIFKQFPGYDEKPSLSVEKYRFTIEFNSY